VSEGGEDAPEDSGGSNPDPEELANALREEGFSDQEIAYVVHGHHAPEVDLNSAAKAHATGVKANLDAETAARMAELEHAHASESLKGEREHKKRMADLDYDDARKQKEATQMEQAHKQRMLDLEYERAKKEPQDEGSPETDKELKQIEVEKKKLELDMRRQEMKLELEFKKREHELKLKQMEMQLKEQARQKSEISSIKHEQKLVETKNPPKEDSKPKKALKKSEDIDE
jgi:hypothetical protein